MNPSLKIIAQNQTKAIELYRAKKVVLILQITFQLMIMEKYLP